MIFKWVVVVFCLMLACLFFMAAPVKDGTLPSFILDSAVAQPTDASLSWIVYAIGIAVGIAVAFMLGISNEIGGALNNNSDSKAFVTALIGLAVFVACAYGLAWISYWSFDQTRLFFRTATGSKDNALYWALFFQYGQNVFLFLSQRTRGRKVQIAPNLALDVGVMNLLAFTLFCVIDGGTNISQWQTENAEIAFSLSWYSALMYPALIIIVFVEELLMYVVAACAHQLNDVFQALGFGRMKLLDTFTSGVGGGGIFPQPAGAGGTHTPPMGASQPGRPGAPGQPGRPGARFQGPRGKQ